MSEEKFFLGRQPILNRSQKIVGFELLFRSAESLRSARISDYHVASASVILTALSNFGFQDVLGRQRGFFNVSYDTLMSSVVELLPRKQVVIELLETILLDAEVLERCRELKSMGFTLALDDHVYNESFGDIYRVVDIIKLDVQAIPEEELAVVARELKRWPLTLLAEKVETAAQYELCASHGFDLFQGYYFARPVVLKQKRVDVAKLTMLQLLEQVMAETELCEIEETFKLHPGLTYNLLRLVNSVAIGLRVRIKTLRHALTVLGLEQLKRWITLSLYASSEGGTVQSPLLETAAVRGKLMELLVKRSGGEGTPKAKEYADQAFMTGVLSLIDVLFEVSMDELVEKLNLVEDVRLALTERSGPLGRLLLLAENLEKDDFAAVNRHLVDAGLGVQDLMDAQLETINWTNRLNLSL